MILSVALALAVQTAPAAPATPPLTVDVKGIQAPPKPKPDPGAVEAGKQIFQTRCVGCHGATGNSDGPVGKLLKPTPQRFTDALWASRVSDAEIATAIKEGGLAVKKSPAMPAHKDLNDLQVKQLTAFIRTLRSPYGTASVTVMLPNGSDREVAVDADATGSARATFAGVAGKATVIGVVDPSGAAACQVEVAEAAGAVVRCAK